MKVFVALLFFLVIAVAVAFVRSVDSDLKSRLELRNRDQADCDKRLGILTRRSGGGHVCVAPSPDKPESQP